MNKIIFNAHHWRTMYRCIALLLAVCVSTAAAAADKTPSGTVMIDEVQIAFIGSGNLGGGNLNFGGRNYGFKIGGLGIGGVGISKIKATGEVYNLKNVADFAGLYGQLRAGVAFFDKSTGGLWLENTSGVVLHLNAERKGLALSLGADGIAISME
jgi:hypothetical protein